MLSHRINERQKFFCNVSSYMATKDYQRQGRCVRLIGVLPHEFSTDALNSDKGVTTYTFDVGFWEYLKIVHGWDRWKARTHADRIEALEEHISHAENWFELELKVVPKGERSDGYFYRTFSDDAITVPVFFELLSLISVASPREIRNFSRAHDPIAHPFSPGGYAKTSSNPYCLYTYHVGQGMCSLIANNSYGILLDAGAGKPVLKPIYQSGAMINDLRKRLAKLKKFNLYMSHADRDHWSLLEWDPAIRKKVSSIFIPDKYRTLEMSDTAVIHKIVPINGASVPLDPQSKLELWRSQPAEPDNNGQCLVAVFERQGQCALIPGDYVYSRMNQDTHGAINTLQLKQFKAVVVPHHGDKASASDVFPAAPDAVAFFSAGTHQRYKHPRKVSKTGHTTNGYQRIVRNRLRHMREVKLL